MADALLLCTQCSRHVSPTDKACPFCGSSGPFVPAAPALDDAARIAARITAPLYGGPPGRFAAPAYGLPPVQQSRSSIAVVLAVVVTLAFATAALTAAWLRWHR